MSEVLEVSEAIGSDAVVNSHFGLIVDIAIGLIILLFAILHARKGLYSAFSGLIAIVVAIALGIAGANLATQPVMDNVWPKVEEAVSEHYDSSVGQAITEIHDVVGETAGKLLSFTHLDGAAEKVLDDSAAISWTEAPKAQLLTLVNTALQEVVHFVLFIIIALLGLLLFKPINALVEKINDAPGLRQLDWLGGFLLGALECVVVLFIVMKVCELRNVSFFRDIQEGSWFITRLMGL